MGRGGRVRHIRGQRCRTECERVTRARVSGECVGAWDATRGCSGAWDVRVARGCDIALKPFHPDVTHHGARGAQRWALARARGRAGVAHIHAGSHTHRSGATSARETALGRDMRAGRRRVVVGG